MRCVSERMRQRRPSVEHADRSLVRTRSRRIQYRTRPRSTIDLNADQLIHVRSAINNGVSKAEMLEIFLQVAVYCGAPAMMDSIRIARKVWAEHEARAAG